MQILSGAEEAQVAWLVPPTADTKISPSSARALERARAIDRAWCAGRFIGETHIRAYIAGEFAPFEPIVSEGCELVVQVMAMGDGIRGRLPICRPRSN